MQCIFGFIINAPGRKGNTKALLPVRNFAVGKGKEELRTKKQDVPKHVLFL